MFSSSHHVISVDIIVSCVIFSPQTPPVKFCSQHREHKIFSLCYASLSVFSLNYQNLHSSLDMHGELFRKQSQNRKISFYQGSSTWSVVLFSRGTNKPEYFQECSQGIIFTSRNKFYLIIVIQPYICFAM